MFYDVAKDVNTEMPEGVNQYLPAAVGLKPPLQTLKVGSNRGHLDAHGDRDLLVAFTTKQAFKHVCLPRRNPQALNNLVPLVVAKYTFQCSRHVINTSEGMVDWVNVRDWRSWVL